MALSPLIIYCEEHYSVDSYGILLSGPEGHIMTFISAFRYFGALIYKVLTAFGHNPLINPAFDTCFAIILLGVSVSILSLFIIGQFENKNIIMAIIIDVGVLLSVINPWFCDLFNFPECIVLTSVGFALCCLSLILWFSDLRICFRVLSVPLLICSTAVYQQFITVFCIYAILICSIKIVNEREFLIKRAIFIYFTTASNILLSGCLYLIIGKILIKSFNLEANSRIAISLENIVTNIKYFISHQHSFLKGRGYYNTEFLTISFISMAIVWLISIIVNTVKTKQFIRNALISISFAFAYCSSYLLGLITTSHATRAMFGLFSIFALFGIGTIVLNKNKYVLIIVSVIMIAVIPVNMIKSTQSGIEQISSNTADREYVMLIFSEIEQYEEQNDIKIKYFGFCYDSNSDFSSNMNIKSSAVTVDYSFSNLISVVSDRDFSIIEIPDEIYKSNFEGKEWDKIDLDEQLKFVKDSVYLCVY